MTANNKEIPEKNSDFFRTHFGSRLLNPVVISTILVLIACMEYVMFYNILARTCIDDHVVRSAAVFTLLIGMFISPVYSAFLLHKGMKKNGLVLLMMTLAFIISFTVFVYLCCIVIPNNVCENLNLFSIKGGTMLLDDNCITPRLHILFTLILSIATFALSYLVNDGENITPK